MVNVDAQMLEADPEVTLVAACFLNHAMARNPAAREAYARIWGTEWQPLGNGMEIDDRKNTGETSQTKTVNLK